MRRLQKLTFLTCNRKLRSPQLFYLTPGSSCLASLNIFVSESCDVIFGVLSVHQKIWISTIWFLLLTEVCKI